MFSVSVSVCKKLVRSKSFRLIYTSVSVKANGLYSKIEVPLDKVDLSEITRYNTPEIYKAVRYVKGININENIDWESLHKKLTEENVRNPTTKIFQACLKLSNVRLAEKYFSYLTEKGYQWTVFDKIYFCKILLMQRSSIPDYEHVFVSLYEEVKPLLYSSSLIQLYLSKIFVEIPHLYNNLVNNQVECRSVAAKAVELHDIDRAFEIIQNNFENLDKNFFEKFSKACIENADNSKFSIDFMNKLVGLCTTNAIALNSDACLETFKSMFEKLNLCDSNYHWSIKDCFVNDDSICSSCQLALKPNTLSVDEFEEMRDDFLNNVILKESYLHSTYSELQKFSNFLKGSQPYDLVIDALNVIYLKRYTGVPMVHHYIKHFLNEGRNVLVVSRSHAKNMILKPSFMKYQKYKNRLQYFFTQNISDDDIFLLYSSLYSGPNTLVVTRDLLRNHSCKLSKTNRCRFLRWQMSNQYFMDPHLNVDKPVSHCNVSQLTHTPTQQNKKYVWHLSHYPNYEILLRRAPVQWICVTATERK